MREIELGCKYILKLRITITINDGSYSFTVVTAFHRAGIFIGNDPIPALAPFLSTEFNSAGRSSMIGFAPAVFRTVNSIVYNDDQVYQLLQHASPNGIGLLARVCSHRSPHVREIDPDAILTARGRLGALDRLIRELAIAATQEAREMALASDLVNVDSRTVLSLIAFLNGRYPVAERALNIFLNGRENQAYPDLFILILTAVVDMAGNENGAT